MIIDAHQHFWNLSRGDYGWLTPELELLYKDFLPKDLAPILNESKVDGTILVQAAPTVAETEYLLELADRNDFIKGVVGWVDFESDNAADEINRLAKYSKLIGLRPMIQDIADQDWMLNPKLTPAFQALIANNLTFDALTLPGHLPNLLKLLEQYPDMKVVIDHASKPEIDKKEFTQWAADMDALANQTHAYCKLSGLITEAGSNWTIKDLIPYTNFLLDTFGSERLIWGSDWPVCLLATNYQEWLSITEELLSLRDHDRDAIFGGNALKIYGIKST